MEYLYVQLKSVNDHEQQKPIHYALTANLWVYTLTRQFMILSSELYLFVRTSVPT